MCSALFCFTDGSHTEVPTSESSNDPLSSLQSPQQQHQYKLLDSSITQELPSSNVPDVLYKFDKEDHVGVLINNIRHNWHSQNMVDVQIVASDKSLYGFHMVMLAGYSSIFQKIFSHNNMNWFNGILAPNDVEAQQLQKLQDCIYQPQKFMEQIEKDHHRNEKALMEFANFFGLEELAINFFLDRKRVLENWEKLLNERSLTFSLLQCDDGRNIPCHGIILVSCSPMFQDQLVEDKDDPLSLYNNSYQWDKCESSIMEKLVKFVYSAEILIDTKSVAGLLQTSCELRILSVAKACCSFIKNVLQPDNCINYLFVADNALAVEQDAFCRVLFEQTEAYIVDHFGLVMETEDFKLQLEEESIVKYMAKADLSELESAQIIQVLLQWYEVNTTGRVEALARLLALVASLKDHTGLSKSLTFASNQDKPRLNYLEQVAVSLTREESQE